MVLYKRPHEHKSFYFAGFRYTYFNTVGSQHISADPCKAVERAGQPDDTSATCQSNILFPGNTATLLAASINSKKTIRARGLRPHNPHFAGVDMLGHPRPKIHQKCIIFLHVFCSILCRSFWCLWLANASKMDAQITPGSMKMMSWQPPLQRVMKK